MVSQCTTGIGRRSKGHKGNSAVARWRRRWLRWRQWCRALAQPLHPRLASQRNAMLWWGAAVCCRYNNSLPVELGARIPARGSAGQAALAVLVGNSRALWEPFLEAVAADSLLQHDNPLEVYMERCLTRSLAACAPG